MKGVVATDYTKIRECFINDIMDNKYVYKDNGGEEIEIKIGGGFFIEEFNEDDEHKLDELEEELDEYSYGISSYTYQIYEMDVMPVEDFKLVFKKPKGYSDAAAIADRILDEVLLSDWCDVGETSEEEDFLSDSSNNLCNFTICTEYEDVISIFDESTNIYDFQKAVRSGFEKVMN